MRRGSSDAYNMPTATATKAKVTNAELMKVDESDRDNPVDFVRRFVIANHKKLGRAGCVRALVTKHGIAYYTARTQYQVVHKHGYKMPQPKTPGAKKPATKAAKE